MEIKSDSPIFIVDSSYLVALGNQNDATHQRAKKIANEISAEIIVVLPGEIFSETINALWRKVNKQTAVVVAKDIPVSTAYTFVETEKEIRLDAVEKFEKAKKSVSFTDCLVMAFADHLKTKTILGFDESFSKFGYSLP